MRKLLAVKAASTAALSTDTSLVVQENPNGPLIAAINGPSTVLAGTAPTTQTAVATGATTKLQSDLNGDPTGVTGYAPSHDCQRDPRSDHAQLASAAHAFGLGLGNRFGRLGASNGAGTVSPPPVGCITMNGVFDRRPRICQGLGLFAVRKLLVLLIALCLPIVGAQAWWQSIQQVGVSAGGGGYTGPNDVVTGALACWGLQACSLAVAGTKVANICNSGDANCADVNSLSNGNFDVTTAQGAPLNCGGTGGTCTVKILYDKSGQTNCNSAACDLSNATIANRPTLVFSCTGLGTSQPCLHFNGTSQELDDGTGGVTITRAQPFTVVAILNAASVASQGAFLAQHSGGTGFFAVFTTTPTLEYQSGATFSSTAVSTSTWYVTQGVMNGASSTTYLNGTSNTGNAGTNGLSGVAGNQLVVGNDGFSQFWNGNAVMWGIWPVGFNSTQAGSMNTNQRGNWGF